MCITYVFVYRVFQRWLYCIKSTLLSNVNMIFLAEINFENANSKFVNFDYLNTIQRKKIEKWKPNKTVQFYEPMVVI